MLTRPDQSAIQTMGSLPDVPGFTRAGDAAQDVVRDLAVRLALNAAVTALELTDTNLASLIKNGPRNEGALRSWKREVGKALTMARNAA